MNRLAIILATLLLAPTCEAQQRLALPDIRDLFTSETDKKLSWELAMSQRALGQSDNQTYSADSAISLLEKLLRRQQSGGENTLFRKDGEALHDVIASMSFLGNELGAFISGGSNSLFDGAKPPINFAMKDSLTVLEVSGIASSKICNTLVLSSKARASKIVSTLILPSLKNFKPLFSDTAIRYYAMTVFYGAEDFSAGPAGLSGEMVAIVVPSDKCKAFVNSEITEDDLLGSADVYQMDKNMGFEIKKIKVSLD